MTTPTGDDADKPEDARPTDSTAPRVDGGRLAVYAALGATAGTVPLPWVPAALVRRVRGALAHDVALRHGLSLSREARDLLAEPSSPDASERGTVSTALRYMGGRLAVRALTRIGPFGAILPLRHAVRMYALGHLLDRYLAGRASAFGARRPGSRRIEEGEARRVRRAIDAAFALATAVSPAPEEEPAAQDDQRDASTVLVDGLLGAAAGVPSHLVRRLDTAFDDALASTADDSRLPDDHG
jgi:hypothetical protein